ncbi:MAG: hypothetical protein KGY48_04340 [Wenzhouxiangellaceae bacterium]|nr:hypothetical protein [Wenzhouxiangellaceae bacterium]MBS3746679.1 hypothetical protein [Wenzhouxiangellaceae bacterium]MBS3822689.1 hypothetical protein [Wenzhouxiangellaceae bacterium]
MKRLCIAAISAALITAGCGDSETPAPDSRDAVGPPGDGAVNPFLASADADTEYVYANLQRLPESLVDKVWAMNDASAESNEAVFEALAEDDDISPAARALLEEIQTLSTRAGWEAAGLHTNPFYAFHSVDLLPFAQLELSDGAAFAELLDRVEANLETSLERREVEGVEITWFDLVEGFGVALRHDQDSVTIAMIPDDAALLARVAGQFQPADPMRAESLESFNRESGLSAFGSGFVDWQRFVNTALTDESQIGGLLHQDAAVTAVIENPACVAEYQAVTRALPRLLFGYTRLSENNADFLVRQETSAALAEGLMPIAQAPVSIDRELSGLFNFGLAFDLVAGREFARSLVDGWVASPPQCPSFASVAEQAPRMQENLNRPIPPVITNLQGVYLQAQSLTLADNGMPTGGGTLSFFMRNPQLLVGMAQMFSPAVAEIDLEPGGEPQPLPDGAIPQLDQANLDAWMAMGENAIGMAIGEDNIDALTAAIEQTDPDDLLLAGRFDFEMLSELIDMAESALDDLEDENAALGLEAQRAQYEAFAEIYDQASLRLRLGDQGIDLIAETTLK